MTPSKNEEKILFTAQHTDLTDAFRSVAREKLARVLARDSEIVRVRLTLESHPSREAGREFTLRAQVEIPGPDLIATTTHADAYAALDALVDKLDRLVKDRHARQKDKRNHPHGVEIPAELPLRHAGGR